MDLLNVFLKDTLSGILFLTARVAAFVGLVPSVYSEMGLQDAFFVKGFRASSYWAFENFLTSLLDNEFKNPYMSPEMSLKSVKFTITLVAAAE